MDLKKVEFEISKALEVIRLCRAGIEASQRKDVYSLITILNRLHIVRSTVYRDD